MKKTVLAFLLIFTALSVFAQNGVLREISGTVELKAAGGAGFVPATIGDEVTQQTVISTGFKSTALVAVGSALIAVRPLTRLTLTEISAAAGTETLNVNLSAGRVRVDVNPPAGTRASMSVSSPSATASVRGTGWEQNTLGITTYNGIVEYQTNNGMYSHRIPEGFSSSVTSNNNVSDPLAMFTRNLAPRGPAGSGSPVGEDNGKTTGATSVTDGGVNVGLRY